MLRLAIITTQDERDPYADTSASGAFSLWDIIMEYPYHAPKIYGSVHP